jgi:uncharacterized protein (DUF305 family)
MNIPFLRIAAVAAAICLPTGAMAQGTEPSSASKELHGVMMSSAKQSQSMKMSGDVDHDFLTMMRHHHQSGIRMAEVQMRQGNSPEVKELARKIIEGQKKEVAEIDDLLGKHQPSAAGSSSRK